jgi:dTDP-glucose 4,6-dehydratase
VEDHVAGLLGVLDRGEPGATYLFGGDAERRNIDVVRTICRILDELQPSASGSYARLITFVDDRPGTTGATPSTRPVRTGWAADRGPRSRRGCVARWKVPVERGVVRARTVRRIPR